MADKPYKTIRHIAHPGMMQKAVNLVQSAAVIVSAVADHPTGPIKASAAVVAERAAICDACEHWNPAGNLGAGMCNQCGCTRAKLNFAALSCPLPEPKWRRVDLTPAP